MALTDVIVTKPLPRDVRIELQNIGLDYLCEGTQDDFVHWMEEAGLIEIEMVDLTSFVRRVWEKRRTSISRVEELKGFTYLLDSLNFRSGDAIFYIYVCGKKP